MNDRRSGLVFGLRVVLELLALGIAFWAALSIRYPELQEENPLYYDYYLQLAIFLHLVWLLLALFSRRLRNPGKNKPSRHIAGIARRWFVHLILLALFIVSLQGYYISRLFLIYFYGFLFLFQLLAFMVFSRILTRRWMPQTRVVLLGSGSAIKRAKEMMQPNSGYVFLGYFTDDPTPEVVPNGTSSEAPIAQADELMLATKNPQHVLRWQRIAEQHTCAFTLLPNVEPTINRELQFHFNNGLLMGRLRNEPLQHWHNRLLKRLFDIVLSVLLLLLSAWWMLPLVWIGIRSHDKGPLFFRQSRPGKAERPFTIFKFRSMRMNSESEQREAVDGDDRITPFGRWMRKHHVDEWPQLWNVLRGDMSLVGPRPHLWMQNDKYRKVVRHFMLRQTLRPGITGLAQVNGLHGDVASDDTIDERVRLDVRYVENWSLALDLSILIRTIFLRK